MARPPNIVFVLTDDQGYGDLGCHGNRTLRTPNLDRLHRESVRFVDYHVGTTCAPTRAGLLTGHYCNSTGVWHTIGGRSLLRADEWTLADALRGGGYRTGHFGKWHLGDCAPFRPHERGFDTSICHRGGGIGNTADGWGNDYFDDTYFVNGRPQRFRGYCTDVFFAEAQRFIAANRDRPFFCYIAPNAPHEPLNVEARHVEPYRAGTPHEARARFYGMIANIDENVGRLRAHLESLGLAEDTILVFMTDNGTGSGINLDAQEFPLEGPGAFNAGMRGQKGSPYEGGHRVPFLLRAPGGGESGGRDVATLTSYVDFMPTILELCGVPVPPGRAFHGRSLVPLLRGAPDASWDARVLVTDTQRVPQPVKWRLSAVMQRRWRLVNGTALYDLKADPGQRQDVAGVHPEQVAALRAAYEEWWQLCARQADRDIPIVLGQDAAPVQLTTHDIHAPGGDAVWNQQQVRTGMACAGYWAVDVRRAGRYCIALRRWPEETGYAIDAAIDGDDSGWRRDCIEARHASAYEGGVAIAIRWARLAIGGRAYHAEVTPGSQATVFIVDLLAGVDRLEAAFHDAAERTLAPYYVTVRAEAPAARAEGSPR